MLRAPLIFPKLKENAVPSQLPGCPSYLSKTISSREAPEDKRIRLEMANIEKAIQNSNCSKTEYEKARTFNSLDELKKCLVFLNIPATWIIVTDIDYPTSINLTYSPSPYLKKCVVINTELIVQVYLEDYFVKTSRKF